MSSLKFSFANVMTQLTGGELLSPAYLTRSASTVFPFGLRNAVGTIGCLTAQRMHPPPTDDEFVGMADYVMEWIHDLLTGDSELSFDSDSSGGSYHPSHECFMAEHEHKNTLEGRVKIVHGGNITPSAHPTMRVRGRMTRGSRLTRGWIS